MIENKKPIKFDLEERTLRFSEEIIDFCKTVPKSIISSPIINQLIRSATSIGANYMEANNAASKKDFRNKIFICKKESQETKYWLRLMKKCSEDGKIDALWQECHEFSLIFQKIISSLNN